MSIQPSTKDLCNPNIFNNLDTKDEIKLHPFTIPFFLEDFGSLGIAYRQMPLCTFYILSRNEMDSGSSIYRFTISKETGRIRLKSLGIVRFKKSKATKGRLDTFGVKKSTQKWVDEILIN